MCALSRSTRTALCAVFLVAGGFLIAWLSTWGPARAAFDRSCPDGVCGGTAGFRRSELAGNATKGEVTSVASRRVLREATSASLQTSGKEELWGEALSVELPGATSNGTIGVTPSTNYSGNVTRKFPLLKLSPCTFGELRQPPLNRSCVILTDNGVEVFNGNYSVAVKFLKGVGLGNLMWQYGVLWAVSRRYHMTPIIWGGEQVRKFFKLSMPPTGIKALGQNYRKSKSGVFPEGEKAHPVLLEGNLQEYTYIKDYISEIRKEFTFHESIQRDTVQKLRGALAVSGHSDLLRKLKNYVKIGVHVRRGDFLAKKSQVHGFTVAPASYLHRAMDLFRRRYSNRTLFVVFTTDYNWTTEALKTASDVVYFSGTRANDLYAASTCDHFVMTVGTFGWWAAMLAGGTTVYYKNFPRKNTVYGRKFNPDTYWPPEWIPMGD